jgi:hypothetical protein
VPQGNRNGIDPMYGRSGWRNIRSSTLVFRPRTDASAGAESASESDRRRYATVASVRSYLAKMGGKDGSVHEERLALRFPRSPGKERHSILSRRARRDQILTQLKRHWHLDAPMLASPKPRKPLQRYHHVVTAASPSPSSSSSGRTRVCTPQGSRDS